MQPTYCADCGLMRLKHQRTCPRCGGTASTTNAPKEKPIIQRTGLTNFTRFAHHGNTFFV